MATVGTVAGGVRRGELGPPRRVVLLSRSEGLAALLRYLLGDDGTLTRFVTLREAADHHALEDADTVVLDLARDGDAVAVAQVRHRYPGELVVLADRGQRGAAPASDPDCTLLERPFSATALGTVLGLSRSRPEPGPVPETAPDPPVAGPRPPAPALAPRLLAMLTQSWQTRRRVRVVGFSAFVLLAFTIAFAVAQGRCGPGCNALGTGLLPAPTIAQSEPGAPPTTGSKRAAATTTTRAGSPGTGAFQGVSGARLTATTIGRQATSTTRKPSSGGGAPPTTPTTGATTTTPTTRATTTTEPPTTPTTLTTPTTTVAAEEEPDQPTGGARAG